MKTHSQHDPPVPHIGAWPNLIGLDSPIVAVCWQAMFAKISGANLPWFIHLILGLSTWCIYLADRIIDVGITARNKKQLGFVFSARLAVCLAALMSLYETFNHGEVAYFDASVTLLFFLLTGRYLDHLMRARARSAVSQLLSLSASSAMVEEADGIPVVDLPWRAEPLCPPPTIHRRLRILLILITTRTTNHKHNVPFRCIAVPGFHLVTYRHIYQDLLVLWKNSISAYSLFSATASISLV